MWWIIFILCVISMMVRFSLWLILFSSFSMDVVVCGFSVLVVLLYSRICGCVVSVWVMLMCCFWLLDNCVGYLVVCVFRFIVCSSLLICVLIFVCGVLVSFSGKVILVVIVCEDSRLKCWKIMLMCWCSVCRLLVFSVVMFLLLISRCLLVGFFRWLISWIRVDFFVLECLMMLNILLVLMVRFSGCSVVIVWLLMV